MLRNIVCISTSNSITERKNVKVTLQKNIYLLLRLGIELNIYTLFKCAFQNI